jgi:hypothetical protein
VFVEVPKENSYCDISDHKNKVAKEDNNDNTSDDKKDKPPLEDDDSNTYDHKKDFKQSTITRDDEQV